MTTTEAIKQLDEWQAQIIHGPRPFGDVADVMRKLESESADLCATLEKCFWHLGEEIKRKHLNESASDGTQALSKEIALVLDRVRPMRGANERTEP